MAFRDFAANETAGLIKGLRDAWSERSLHELRVLSHALDAAATATESALVAEANSEPDDGAIGELIERLSAAAASDAEAVAHQTLTAAQAEQEQQRRALEAKIDETTAAEAALRQQATEAEQALNQLHAEATKAKEAARQAASDHERAAAETQARLDEAAALNDKIQSELGATQTRLQALEGACTEMQDARRELEGLLADAIRGRSVLVEELEQAREAVSVAQAETESSKGELQSAVRQVRDLEEADKSRVAEAKAASLADQRRKESIDLARLGRMRRALQTIDAATAVSDVLEVLVEQLAHEFPRVALFVVRNNRLEGLRSCGLSAETDIKSIAVPLTGASPLTRAVTEQLPARLDVEADSAGLFGGHVACALALPVVAAKRVIAVAYVEQPQDLPGWSDRHFLYQWE